VRRGGLAGVTVRGTFDTAESVHVPPEEIEHVLRSLPVGRRASVPRHPDSFQYELTVKDGRRAAVLDESELPATLRPLVDAAVRRGRLA
jgi:Emfourin